MKIVLFATTLLFLLNFSGSSQDKAEQPESTAKAAPVLESESAKTVEKPKSEAKSIKLGEKAAKKESQKPKPAAESKPGEDKKPAKPRSVSLFPFLGEEGSNLLPIDDLALPPLPELPPSKVSVPPPRKKMINGRLVIATRSPTSEKPEKPKMEMRRIAGKWVICPKN